MKKNYDMHRTGLVLFLFHSHAQHRDLQKVPLCSSPRSYQSSSAWSSLALQQPTECPAEETLPTTASQPPWTVWFQPPPAALSEERPSPPDALFLPWPQSPQPPLGNASTTPVMIRSTTRVPCPNLTPRHHRYVERSQSNRSQWTDQFESPHWTTYPSTYTPQLDNSELIVVPQKTSRHQLLVPSCSPTAMMDSPPRVYDEMNRDLSETHDENLAMNVQPPFDWCLIDQQYLHDAPYSHDIYATGPCDLDDFDSMFNCDITDLDNYLHMPATDPVEQLAEPGAQQAPLHQQEDQMPSTSSSSDDVLEEFFPDLSPSGRQRHSSSSTVSNSSVRADPYSVTEYRLRRDRNNEASKRSRAKRADKFALSKIERADLEKKNIELRTTVAALEVQVADYKRMVLMVVGNK